MPGGGRGGPWVAGSLSPGAAVTDSLARGRKVICLYALDPAGWRTVIPRWGDAADDAASVFRRADVRIGPDRACREKVAGRHDWTPDGTATVASCWRVLRRWCMHHCGRVEASDRDVRGFLSDDRTDEVIAYLPGSPSSAVPPQQLEVLELGLEIASVHPLPDGWVRVGVLRL